MRSAKTAVPAGLIALALLAGVSALAAAAPRKGEQPAPEPAAPTPAQVAEQTGKALVAVVDGDPLELARIVQRAGDAAVLSLLAPATDTLVRLAAVRASPWLRAPERALAALAEIASGRDPELGPAAARAALRIARQLDAASLARREHIPAELTPVLVQLRALGVRESAAAHVRAYASAAAEQLLGAGVPLPPPAAK